MESGPAPSLQKCQITIKDPNSQNGWAISRITTTRMNMCWLSVHPKFDIAKKSKVFTIYTLFCFPIIPLEGPCWRRQSIHCARHWIDATAENAERAGIVHFYHHSHLSLPHIYTCIHMYMHIHSVHACIIYIYIYIYII